MLISSSNIIVFSTTCHNTTIIPTIQRHRRHEGIAAICQVLVYRVGAVRWYIEHERRTGQILLRQQRANHTSTLCDRHHEVRLLSRLAGHRRRGDRQEDRVVAAQTRRRCRFFQLGVSDHPDQAVSLEGNASLSDLLRLTSARNDHDGSLVQHVPDQRILREEHAEDIVIVHALHRQAGRVRVHVWLSLSPQRDVVLEFRCVPRDGHVIRHAESVVPEARAVGGVFEMGRNGLRLLSLYASQQRKYPTVHDDLSERRELIHRQHFDRVLAPLPRSHEAKNAQVGTNHVDERTEYRIVERRVAYSSHKSATPTERNQQVRHVLQLSRPERRLLLLVKGHQVVRLALQTLLALNRRRWAQLARHLHVDDAPFGHAHTLQGTVERKRTQVVTQFDSV